MNALGPVRQFGFMTRDIRQSVAFFVEHLSIGPWFLSEMATLSNTRYRGEPVTPTLSVAFAHYGGLEYELMQVHGGEASMWAALLDKPFEREMLHHWCAWPEDYDAALSEATALGYRVVQDGATARGRFAYLETAGVDMALEITEATPARKELQALVANSALDWDGRTHFI